MIPPQQPNPLSPERQRLEKERSDLQEEWNLRRERLSSLRQALAVETNAPIRVQLEQQILSDEEEIKSLRHRLSEIEQALTIDAGRSSRRLIGCSGAFALTFVIGGIVISLSVTTSRFSPPINQPLLSPLPSPTVPSQPTPFFPDIYPSTTPVEMKEDYLKLEELLKQRMWVEADLQTAQIMLPSKVGAWWNPDTSLCVRLKRIDALWTIYSASQFGLEIQSQIWRSSNTNDLDFRKNVGWLNNNSLAKPDAPNYNLGYFPKALWSQVTMNTGSLKMGFRKLEACGIQPNQ